MHEYAAPGDRILAPHRLGVMPNITVARHLHDLRTATGLLADFNQEFGDPVLDPDWFAAHLHRLVQDGTAGVLMIGEPETGVAVLRFRTSTWADAPETYLAEFYVAPAQRGQGLGTALLQAVLDHARERGCTYIDLNTTQADEAACHLYEKFGFDCHEGRGEGPLAIYYELDL